MRIDSELPSHHCGVLVEAAQPEASADDDRDDVRRFIVFRGKRTPDNQSGPKYRAEIICRDQFRFRHLRLSPIAKIHGSVCAYGEIEISGGLPKLGKLGEIQRRARTVEKSRCQKDLFRA